MLKNKNLKFSYSTANAQIIIYCECNAGFDIMYLLHIYQLCNYPANSFCTFCKKTIFEKQEVLLLEQLLALGNIALVWKYLNTEKCNDNNV